MDILKWLFSSLMKVAVLSSFFGSVVWVMCGGLESDLDGIRYYHPGGSGWWNGWYHASWWHCVLWIALALSVKIIWFEIHRVYGHLADHRRANQFEHGLGCTGRWISGQKGPS